ncbi:MAG: TrwC relaxase, partial [Actinobacteria bacterium]|nr:TrwC relaxase [Actinomycetota bacterium]
PVSAASQARTLADPATRLAAAADRYYDSLNTAAVDYLKREHGADAMSRIDTAAESALPGLTRHEAYPTLRAHLALCAVDGHDPGDMLRYALSSDRGLGDARDVAAVLDWRLDPPGRRSTSSGTGAPLSWLPAVPDALSADPEWGTYLRDRAAQVSATATEVVVRANAWTPTSAPGWALTIIDRDPALAADLAVWRAANDVPDTDRRPTGPPLPAAADARAQRALDQRVTRLLGDPRAATVRWKPLADSIDERIAAEPYWPTLADRLTIAERAGIDITSLTHAVGGESPLPDEQPAAALWWRLSRHLSPAATTATDHSVSDTLRPDWTPVLGDIVGADAADRVLADPAWPALVAAVTHARRDGWDAEQLLSTSHDLLLGGQPEDEPLRPDELATALVWRIGMLTDTAATHDGYSPPDPADEPPIDLDDLRALPDADPHFDADWLASLTEPDPGDTEPEPVSREDLAAGRVGAAPSYVTDIEEDPIAAVHAALDARAEERDFARVAEEHFWATA